MPVYSLISAEFPPAGQDIVSPAGAEPDYRPAGIEFRHLHYFVAVAEDLHFGRAAARLYISQPGLSQAIARLERDLNVQLLRRIRSNVELTDAGAELLDRARRLLADLQDAVTRVRVLGSGAAGLVRLGVATLAEPVVAPALRAFAEDHGDIRLDRAAMASEPLFAQLRDGLLDTAVIYEIPALATADGVAWEPVRRGRLAILAGRGSPLARREIVTLAELSGETFLVYPRSIAPGALAGLKLMCREFGGFDATVLESAAAPGMGWSPIQDGIAIAVMPEATASAVRPAGVAVIPVSPPPQYVLAMAWRCDERAAVAHRFLSYIRAYRDQHGWITKPELAPSDPSQVVNGGRQQTKAARKLRGAQAGVQPT